jgi:hypothetical protein
LNVDSPSGAGRIVDEVAISNVRSLIRKTYRLRYRPTQISSIEPTTSIAIEQSINQSINQSLGRSIGWYLTQSIHEQAIPNDGVGMQQKCTALVGHSRREIRTIQLDCVGVMRCCIDDAAGSFGRATVERRIVDTQSSSLLLFEPSQAINNSRTLQQQQQQSGSQAYRLHTRIAMTPPDTSAVERPKFDE